MTLKQSIITYSYHFFSEALITFLAIVPFLHLYFHHVPYFAYFFMMIGFTIIFAFVNRWATHYATYLAVAPLLFVAFYFVQLPWMLSAILAFFFVWRYIQIRSIVDHRREQSYIRWALIFSIINVFVVDDQWLVVYLFILFLVLIVGYMSRHLVAIPHKAGQTFNPLIWLYIVLGIVTSTGIIYFLFPAVRLFVGSLWQGFIHIIIFIGSTLVKFLTLLNLFNFEPKDAEEEQVELGRAGSKNLEQLEIANLSIFEIIVKAIFWGVIALVAAYLLWRAYNFYQKRFRRVESVDSAVEITHESIAGAKQNRKNIMQRMIERIRRGPRHPIRKLVYDAERKLAGTDFARQQHETVEDWLRRIGIDGKLATYQDVRYGDIEASQQATEQLQIELEKIENKRKNEGDPSG